MFVLITKFINFSSQICAWICSHTFIDPSRDLFNKNGRVQKYATNNKSTIQIKLKVKQNYYLNHELFNLTKFHKDWIRNVVVFVGMKRFHHIHCAHNRKEKQWKSVIKWLVKATKSQNFCQKMPFFCHRLLHKLTKCHFSQNLSVRLFFSYLHPFLNISNECFMQKTQGWYFSSLFSLPKRTVFTNEFFKSWKQGKNHV